MPLFMVALVAITPILLFFVAEQAAFTAGSTTPLMEISDFISIAAIQKKLYRGNDDTF